MSYASSAVIRSCNIDPHSGSAGRRAGPYSPWHHLGDAIAALRQRRLDGAIANYLGGPCGKFTDEAEREIERRFLSNPSRW